MPKKASDVVVFFNPGAGARPVLPRVEAVSQQLAKSGFHVVLSGDAAKLSRTVADSQRAGRLRAVVAAGGDGTVSLAANQTPPGTPLAILPLGTENLLAKHLGATARVAELCAVVRRGTWVHLDAGRANGRMFLLMAGCGFDAEVVRRLHQARSGHIRHLSYVKPILQSIRSYEYPELRLYLDHSGDTGGKEPSIRARWAFVLNLPCYAAGLGIVPDADGTDGRLDVCTFRKGSLVNGLRYLMGVVGGWHRRFADCTTARVRRLRIESDAEVPFQIDGDPGGRLPLEIEVLPRRLTLLVPEHRLRAILRPDGSDGSQCE